MANKPRNPIKLSPKMTNEQMQELAKKQQEEQELKRIAYFAQRREGIAVNILTSLCRGNGFAYPKDQDNFGQLVDLSVEMTDRLLEKLYPKPEEKK